MIGLDTNVLVRYIVQDDPGQAALATKLIESLTPEAQGFVSQVVLVETVWVLEASYGADADKIAAVVETLLRIGSILVDRADLVWRTLRLFKQDGGDFSDALVSALAREAGCSMVCTFDQAAAKRSGMTLLK